MFREGLKQIRFTKDDFLYVIGDAIDRGLDGIRLLREIKRKPNMDLLLGNHEQMMLQSVDPSGGVKCTGKDADLWLDWNGGDVTYEKYRYNLSKQDRKELLFWLRTRDLMKNVFVTDQATGKRKHFVLSHSYYDEEYVDQPYDAIPEETAFRIVWCSMFRRDWKTRGYDVYSMHDDITFVTGHVPVQRIVGDFAPLEAYRYENMWNIDGGLAFGETLVPKGAIFLRLEDMQQFVIPFRSILESE